MELTVLIRIHMQGVLGLSCVHDTNPRFGARHGHSLTPLFSVRDFGRLTGRVRTSQRRGFWLLPLRLLRTDRGITSVLSLLVTSPLLSGSFSSYGRSPSIRELTLAAADAADIVVALPTTRSMAEAPHSNLCNRTLVPWLLGSPTLNYEMNCASGAKPVRNPRSHAQPALRLLYIARSLGLWGDAHILRHS